MKKEINPAIAIVVIVIIIVVVGFYAWSHGNNDVVSGPVQPKTGARDK